MTLADGMTLESDEMRIDPSRAQVLATQIGAVRERVTAAANGRSVRQLQRLHFCNVQVNGRLQDITDSARRCIQIKTCKRHSRATSGANLSGAFRRELCPGVESKGRLATKVDTMALHRWPAVWSVYLFHIIHSRA
jgi:hypothetical protein